MTARRCKYRSAWWQVWKPKRSQWYGGGSARSNGRGGVESRSWLHCGCGCNTPHPDNGKWVES